MQREYVSIPKIVLYILFALLVYVLQSTIYGTWSLRGYHLDLLPALVAAAALLDGPAEGVIIGVTVGLFYDMGFIGVDGLYPLFFLLFGFIAGEMSRLSLSGSYVSMVLMTSVVASIAATWSISLPSASYCGLLSLAALAVSLACLTASRPSVSALSFI